MLTPVAQARLGTSASSFCLRGTGKPGTFLPLLQMCTGITTPVLDLELQRTCIMMYQRAMLSLCQILETVNVNSEDTDEIVLIRKWSALKCERHLDLIFSVSELKGRNIQILKGRKCLPTITFYQAVTRNDMQPSLSWAAWLRQKCSWQHIWDQVQAPVLSPPTSGLVPGWLAW